MNVNMGNRKIKILRVYTWAWTTASGQKCLFATLRYVA